MVEILSAENALWLELRRLHRIYGEKMKPICERFLQELMLEDATS